MSNKIEVEFPFEKEAKAFNAQWRGATFHLQCKKCGRYESLVGIDNLCPACSIPDD